MHALCSYLDFRLRQPTNGSANGEVLHQPCDIGFHYDKGRVVQDPGCGMDEKSCVESFKCKRDGCEN